MRNADTFCRLLPFAMAAAMICCALAEIPSECQVPAQTSASPQEPAPAKAPAVSAVRGVLLLRTSLTSGNVASGKEVKAILKQEVTLPDNEKLPKGTVILGSVLAVSKHSKEKPNSTLLLEFDHAVMKGSSSIHLLVRIQKLAPSVATEDARTTLPNSNAGMVALASSSGGGAQLRSQMSDRSDLQGKYKEASMIDGVYLSPSAQGSGAVFSLGEDVYLDEDVQMTVLLAHAPEKQQ